MRMIKRLAKALVALALVLVALVIAGGAAVFFTLRSSLPDYDMAARVPGLGAPVTITRDGLAVPSIRAATYEDASRALGFVHAQDRFFRMDLARRVATGRLSELVGPPTVGFDTRLRTLRLGDVAERRYRGLPERHRRLLEAYTQGVNAALAILPAPPEYAVLRAERELWRAQDCILVELNMHLGLSRFGNVEDDVALMRETLPAALVEFLTPRVTRFDAPLIEAEWRPEPAPIPGPDVVDVRSPGWLGRAPEHATPDEPLVPGSNSFAVDGSRTVDGRAILGNDMHLGIDAPNIWYRAELIWGAGVESGRCVGVTLPGVPAIIVGSNTRVAWGFTNISGDFVDEILIETVEGDPDRYLTPDGPEPFQIITETIRVRGRRPVMHEMRSTRWGVVDGEDRRGRPLVTQWIALEPERCNLAILDMAGAASLQEAIDIARAWRGPPQNVLLASGDGRIAWVPAGDVPLRAGFDGTVPMARTDRAVGWFGSIPERARPTIVDPASGALWTANARTLPLEHASVFGHNWPHPYRAYRIRELLLERDDHTERSLFDIALDARTGAYDFYRDLAVGVVAPDEADPVLAGARDAVASWSGFARRDDTGMAILGEFRARLSELVIGPLLGPARRETEGFFPGWLCMDESLRRVLEARPAHLLDPGFGSWDELIRAALAHAAGELEREHPATAPRVPWSLVNRTRTKHALTQSLPFLVPVLDMPGEALEGHPWSPRVAAPVFGASERMVVSPGHEVDGILQMPTGQSGHPLSRHYRDMQEAWLRGDPTPLLPGPPVYTTTLTP